MKTAIITGASSGLGREYTVLVKEFFPEIECIWLIARRAERLEDLKVEIQSGVVVRVVPLDLLAGKSWPVLERLLEAEDPNISLLINSAGCGFLGMFEQSDLEEQVRMVALNNEALLAVTRLCLPYMEYGGRIINASSIASFVPTPRMTVYSATKSFVSAFSRGLQAELKPRAIKVTAVCPGPMNTEFLDVGRIYGNSTTFQSLPYCDPGKVAAKSLQAAKRGRSVYTPRFLYKLYRVLAKCLPHALLVRFTKT